MRPPFDDIKIDPQFRQLLPPLDEDAYAGLKAQILRDKRFRDPIVTWYDPELEVEILADGHNRLSLWEDEDIIAAGIEPPRKEGLVAKNRDEVMEWMIRQQLGKRNLSPEMASRLRAKLYKVEVKTDWSRKSLEAQSEPLVTAERVAQQTGVSAATVKRDVAYDNALEAIGAVNPKFLADYDAGRIKPNGKKPARQLIMRVGKLPRDEMGKALRNIRAGRAFDDDGERRELPFAEKRAKVQTEVAKLEKVVDQASLTLGRIVDVLGQNNVWTDSVREHLQTLKDEVCEWREAA